MNILLNLRKNIFGISGSALNTTEKILRRGWGELGVAIVEKWKYYGRPSLLKVIF